MEHIPENAASLAEVHIMQCRLQRHIYNTQIIDNNVHWFDLQFDLLGRSWLILVHKYLQIAFFFS